MYGSIDELVDLPKVHHQTYLTIWLWYEKAWRAPNCDNVVWHTFNYSRFEVELKSFLCLFLEVKGNLPGCRNLEGPVVRVLLVDTDFHWVSFDRSDY